MDIYRMGIDIGSTTAKVAVLDDSSHLLFSSYRRHNAETLVTLLGMVQEAQQALGDVGVNVIMTGSAGLGVSEKFGLPFIQEVIASTEVVHQLYPQVRTLIDIGGEDAKMVFFQDGGMPDIRMNGSCAGGTGAFIDQMATLLNISLADLNDLSEKHTSIYPIASRCGVFAKTDVQSLLAREIAREDIAASIFNAVVLQTLATLSRGCKTLPAVLMAGGPLTFIPELQKAFLRVLKMDPGSLVQAPRPELLSAIGAALAAGIEKHQASLSQLADHLNSRRENQITENNRLEPLFLGGDEQQTWLKTRNSTKAPRRSLTQACGEEVFLGIDSGSTTTKLVLVDREGNLLFGFYRNNNGNALGAVKEGLQAIHTSLSGVSNKPRIVYSTATGYGEDLVRTAFGCDQGIVETLAHFRAARSFNPKVSFILDIGGQDMKAIFVRDGHIWNIEINEACSSGCGSFIQTFAGAMGYEVSDFACKALDSHAPCDLGTRCTVFMNSRVKQALREGAEISDISAGLAYSVIKNAFHKVLKIANTEVLGEHVLVQGGTFRNPAIHKAIEVILERSVTCPDIPELMGAYGAALTARDTYTQLCGGASRPSITGSRFIGLEQLDTAGSCEKKYIHCQGCENHCTVTKLIFQNNNVFYTGNRCEKIFSNSGTKHPKGVNLVAKKEKLLFDRPTEPEGTPVLTIGIPRVLNMFENYPFWNALLVESGFRVRISDPSSSSLYEKGVQAIMSENICFPAKLVSGHFYNLIDARVDRIFYPMVFMEDQGFKDAFHSFNCPIVSGYPDVARAVIDPQKNYNIPLDTPSITFRDLDLLRKNCHKYLKQFGVSEKTFRKAFEKALVAQHEFKENVRRLGAEILAGARQRNEKVILMMIRPYHVDELVNHKAAEIVTDFGMDVITEDSIPLDGTDLLENRNVTTQWEYPNRYLASARWVGKQEDVEMLQLNSFGCGPDAIITDEAKAILTEYGKRHSVIRVDEIESPGSIKLRVRSLIESMDSTSAPQAYKQRPKNRIFDIEDRRRLILAPEFAPFATPPLTRPLLEQGFRIETLPPANRETVNVALKHTNNEICYPASLLIGDLLKAVLSGKYDRNEIALGIVQTGRACRASNYLALLKKGLTAAGFEDIPIVSIATSTRAMHDQPGFNYDFKRYVYIAALGLVYSDCLSNLYHSTAVREVNKGDSWKVAKKYLDLLEFGGMPMKRGAVLKTLEEAVAEFNNIEAVDRDIPKTGIVGEIYAKVNPFCNNYVAQWLMDQGIEVIIPPLLGLFTSWLFDINTAVQANLAKPSPLWALSLLLRKILDGFVGQADIILQKSRFYHPHQSIEETAVEISDVVSLTQQYGEEWLLPGEIAQYYKHGIPNIICVQPFGCLPNHVVAKGLGKRLKEKYPELNLLFLDVDAGVSEVNFINRLYFFASHARAYHKSQEIFSPTSEK